MSARKVCSVCSAEYGEDQKFCPNDGSPLRAGESVEGLTGQIIADRYRVLSTLGEGGMGRVYLAEHIRMGRRCAVKVISPALASTDAAVARFNREAANASQINHPNVVQVYDFGEGPNHTLYLAMEYVNGQTLTALVRRDGPLPLRRAATLTKQVADALGAAHHQGIVHRDLKPDNILVTRQHDGSELVKVVDFGIAKTVQADGNSGAHGGQTVTTVGVSIGTPEYMSPEQLAGERLDIRTDLYSLGLVFFHLLTADLPYPRVTSRETLIHRLSLPPRTLREVRPNQDWPDGLQATLDRALAADPEKRYATAADFARDLSTLIASAPAEPDVTVPLRSAGTAPPLPPTATERVAVAPTLPEKSGVAPTPAPAVAAPPKRRRMSIVVGLAAVVIAGVVYLSKFGPTAPPPPATIALGEAPTTSPTTSAPAGTDSVPAIPASQSQQTVDRPVAAPLANAETTKAPVLASSQPASTKLADSNRVTAAEGPMMQRVRQTLVLRHAYLQANGDSGATRQVPLNAPIPARVAAIQQEADGHVALGRRSLIGGDVNKARLEFRQAVMEVTGAVTLLPNNPDVLRLRDSISTSLRNIVMQCQTAIQRGALRPVERNFRCPSLVPARFMGARGRAGVPPS